MEVFYWVASFSFMLYIEVKSKQKLKLQSLSMVHKYHMFTESFMGEKFAKINKGKATYKSLEKRQSKDNRGVGGGQARQESRGGHSSKVCQLSCPENLWWLT